MPPVVQQHPKQARHIRLRYPAWIVMHIILKSSLKLSLLATVVTPDPKVSRRNLRMVHHAPSFEWLLSLGCHLQLKVLQTKRALQSEGTSELLDPADICHDDALVIGPQARHIHFQAKAKRAIRLIVRTPRRAEQH